MKTIKATSSTYLKKKPIQSSELPDHQKVPVPLNKEYNILNYSEAEQGHYLVELDYGAGKWYLWSGHWYLPWEEHNEQVISSSTASKASVTAPNKHKFASFPQNWQEVNWNDFNAPVSQHFTVKEVTKGDRRRIPQSNDIKSNIFTLAQELEKVRKAWGSPIIVTSWYRPPAINRAVRGASNSQHIYGKAVDIKPVKGDIYKFQSWLDKVAWKDKALGYGAPRGFVHLDLRPGNIRWNY